MKECLNTEDLLNYEQLYKYIVLSGHIISSTSHLIFALAIHKKLDIIAELTKDSSIH